MLDSAQHSSENLDANNDAAAFRSLEAFLIAFALYVMSSVVKSGEQQVHDPGS